MARAAGPLVAVHRCSTMAVTAHRHDAPRLPELSPAVEAALEMLLVSEPDQCIEVDHVIVHVD